MRRFLFGILVCLNAFTACKKDNHTDIIEPQSPTFSVKEIAYFIEDIDSLTIITHEVKPQTFDNYGQTIFEVKYEEKYDGFLMSSKFEFSGSLPPNMDLSKLEVLVPGTVVANKVYLGVYKWPFSEEKKQKPYVANTAHLTTIKVPSKSKIAVYRSLDEKLLLASCTMTIVNEITGESTVVKGKWRGTLEYNNEKVVLRQVKLD
ncbi:hypothetical protein ADIARSV_0809 [Arcticibacter svalbardensis MN12-7]|uniref:Lipoprotein n=1 Tax=Arcticibacter svalbardensis MN12-7 TaxID=1150600 RepID=R9GWE6_9SPHI|nr:hypothetical protein [Arcticibacter svalbardensis]EOR95993.1 hypothetical protein ADIARSV_0809 [Arcticibacter svalbardensis MN12-7]